MRSRSALPVVFGLVTAGPVLRQRQAVAPQASAFGPFTFTSTYNLVATPERVINGTTVTPGEAGSIGFYNYGINSELDLICYVRPPPPPPPPLSLSPPLGPHPLTDENQNITLMGVTGPFSSPAVTATHIHEAVEGASGPPRIAFPNPEPQDSGPEVVKRSAGCIQGPFSTGIQAEGIDTGNGFTLAQIEANPAGFFTDSHTAVSVPGVVRAQLQANAVAVGGVGVAPVPINGLQPLNGLAPTVSSAGCTVVSAGPPITVVCA